MEALLDLKDIGHSLLFLSKFFLTYFLAHPIGNTSCSFPRSCHEPLILLCLLILVRSQEALFPFLCNTSCPPSCLHFDTLVSSKLISMQYFLTCEMAP